MIYFWNSFPLTRLQSSGIQRKDSMRCSDISVKIPQKQNFIILTMSIKSLIKVFEKIFVVLRWWMLCSAKQPFILSKIKFYKSTFKITGKSMFFYLKLYCIRSSWACQITSFLCPRTLRAYVPTCLPVLHDFVS